MSYELTLVAVPFALSFVLMCILVGLLGRLTDRQLRVGLLVWSLPVVLWTLASTLRALTTVPAYNRLLYSVRFVGTAIAPVGYLLFAAAYTDREDWFDRRRLAGLFLIPLLTFVFLVTNSIHHLVLTEVEYVASQPMGITATVGPWFLVHAGYAYLLIILGGYWLASEFGLRHGQSLYRQQIAVLLGATVLVMGANALFNLGVTTIEWTPVAGGIATALFLGAIFQYRLFDITPIARDVVVENIDTGMLVLDSDDVVVDVNGPAARILDTDIDQLPGTPVESVFITSVEHLDALSSDPETNETITVEMDGTNRYHDVSVSPITDESGATVGRVVLFTDVTKRVTRKDQLEEQKAALERQNEQLDRFTAVISHDLRTPLATASSYLELARETENEEYFDNIERSLERMETMIDELLTVVQAERTVEVTQSVAVADLVGTAWESVQRADVHLDSTLPAEMTVEADPNLLQHIFENLFQNAVEHNDSPVTVSVGVLGNRQGIYVEDDGHGIPTSDRERVFDHGYTTADGGTGMGLSIVRELVESHGWTISITEGTDGGARFEITDIHLDQ